MARFALGLSTLVFAAVITLLWVQRDQLFAPPDDPAPIATQDQVDPSPESILSVIETLESESKGNATSTGFRLPDVCLSPDESVGGQERKSEQDEGECRRFRYREKHVVERGTHHNGVGRKMVDG